MMAVYRRGKTWWYKFVWNGELIRRSTKQWNKRVAEQVEAAYRTALAKGEVGIREKKPAPTLAEFAEKDFLPFLKRTSDKKAQYYGKCVRNLKSFPKLLGARLDRINHDLVQEFIDYRRAHRFEFRTGKGRQLRRDGQPLEVGTVNRDLATLRRMLNLAVEWGRLAAAPKVRLLGGENRRERALTDAEDAAFVKAATHVGQQRAQAYEAALEGVRAMQRHQQPRKPDAYQLRDLAVIMLDAALRPDECYRLKPENIREGAIWIFEGKTKSARRRIPMMTERLRGVLEMRIAQTV